MNLDPSVAALLLATGAGSGGAQADVQVPGTATRLPDALIDRLMAAVRPLVVSGTLTQAQGDGAVALRTQFGVLQFQSGNPVPTGGQAVLTLPPPGPGLSAAALTARPVPATLLLPGQAPATPPATAASGGLPVAGSALRSAPVLPGGQPVSELGGAPRANALPAASAPAPGQGAPAPPGSIAPSAGGASAARPPLASAPQQATAGQAGATAIQPGPAGPGTPAASSARTPLSVQATHLYGRTASSAVSLSGPAPAPGTANLVTASQAGHTAVPSVGQHGSPTSPAKPTLLAPNRPMSAPPTAAPAGAMPSAPALPAAASTAAAAGVTPALREALTILSQLDPGLAGQVAQRSVPQPGPQMGTALLLFVAAARGGDVRGWLGDRPARMLEASGKGDVANRLSGEFSTVTRQMADTPAGDWRSLPVPVFDRGEWSELHLHIGPEPQDDGGDPLRPRGKRFVIDVALSRLGPLQLDGMLTIRHLDLAVRTYEPFPLAERREMAATFAKTCEATGLTGHLVFQPGGHHWMRLASSASAPNSR